MASLVWRKIVQVGGVATELFGVSASSIGSPKFQLLFIPGNPGSAKYFETQLQLIHERMNGSIDVFAITHAGHSHDPQAGGDRLWSLQDQIQHKADFIKSFMLLPGRPPLIVIGHSIGAYIALQAVAYSESQPQNLSYESARPPILKVLALFPFFWIDRSQWKIRLLRVLASCYEIMGRVAQLISSLPSWIQLAIVRNFSKGLDADAVKTTQQLITRSAVRNNFYLAKTEFRDLDQPPPWNLLRGLGRRLHMLGCPNDVWMTQNQFLECKNQIDGLQAVWVPEASHAYCTSLKECKVVTDIMHDIIEDPFNNQAIKDGIHPDHVNNISLVIETSTVNSQDQEEGRVQASKSKL